MTEGASNGGNHKLVEHDLKTTKWVLFFLFIYFLLFFFPEE